MGDAALTAVFAVLAVSTYRYGLRAPTLVAVVKAVLVVGATVAVAGLVVTGLGSPADLFARADAAFAAQGGTAALVPGPALAPAYVSLAVGSALALFAFPHVLQVAFSARSGTSCAGRPSPSSGGRRCSACSRSSASRRSRRSGPPRGRSELAIPLLVLDLAPGWAAGLILGAVVVAALVPAAVMSIGAATLFARNVYLEFVNPTATEAQVTRMARLMSLVVKVGALAFALGVRDQAAINLHLLGRCGSCRSCPRSCWDCCAAPRTASPCWRAGCSHGGRHGPGGPGRVLLPRTAVLRSRGRPGVRGCRRPRRQPRRDRAGEPLLDRLGVPRGLSGLLRPAGGAVRRNGVAR
ncbi:hypothetical protein DN402_04965 [Streptomyces sp. SW4]|nr:hypothetical protein DN402_04965 [Streptomyces sp. SW4]